MFEPASIGYAGAARLRPIECLPWVLAVLVYFFAPNYLPLGAYIVIIILFALSLDLILGYGGIVTLGHAAYFGFGAYAPACSRSASAATRCSASRWRRWGRGCSGSRPAR